MSPSSARTEVRPESVAGPVQDRHFKNSSASGLALAALGIIYGDIGTSPLYTIRECFGGSHGVEPSPSNVLGIMSLVFWSLILIVSVKYLVFVLRADNNGEGGIFSLLATLKSVLANDGRRWSVLTLLTAVGASLLYGDGVITPAISVLSAVEGLNVATDAAAPFILPLTSVILLGLFAIQRFGTAVIGRLFGPIMVLWFLVLGGLGLIAIVRVPSILAAMNPVHAVNFFAINHFHGVTSLASVVLCITGCEALYADMGHFGRFPVRVTWYGIVLPCLLLNYFGQCALLLTTPAIASGSPFFALAPKGMLYLLVVLATMATIIASQAMISGVFSLTQQAIQLGFAPRMRIVHTSAQTKGQIYMPSVNWLLMLACLCLVLVFQHSSRLAAAYGFAVTGTMTVTSLLFFEVSHHKWRWPLAQSVSFLVVFFTFDCAYLSANVLKVADGGWITVLIAGLIAVSMITWRQGRQILATHYSVMRMPVSVFLADLASYSPARTPGMAVFMTISPEGVPHSLLHHLKHTEALHEQVVLLSVLASDVPQVPEDRKVTIDNLGQGFYRVRASYGFMETPSMARILQLMAQKGIETDIYTTSFFLGRETLLPTGQSRMSWWRKTLFIFMSRNAWNATMFFGLPPERVIELGNQVEM